MNTICYIETVPPKKGAVTLTDEYFVIQGKHYLLRDWYIKKKYGNVSIRLQDILSIDFIKMRSKRMLMIFIGFLFVLVTFGKKIHRFSEEMFIGLIMCIAILFVVYLFNVHSFFRVSSIGYMVAVDVKDYNKNNLEYLKLYWYSLGTRYAQYTSYERNQYFS